MRETGAGDRQLPRWVGAMEGWTQKEMAQGSCVTGAVLRRRFRVRLASGTNTSPAPKLNY